MDIELKPHQRKAYQAVFANLKQENRKQMVVIPTGGGKTVIACAVIKKQGGQAVFLVHTDELVKQTVKTLQLLIPASSIGVVKGDRDETHKRVIVASVQSLRNPKRLARFKKSVRTVVVDECHHAPAKTYETILRYFAESEPLVLGVTATPWRLDGKKLDEIFPRTVAEFTIKDGIEGGWLSNVVGKLVYLKDADFSGLHLDHGDFKPFELEKVMRAANWDEHVAKAYFEHAGDRKTLVFVPTVAMAHQLAERIQSMGGLAEAVDGKMNLEKRRDIVARLAAGKLKVVINCAVLTEGFDDPSVSCVIMARPTASWGLFVQCIGRGLRPNGKKTCLVLDVVGGTRRHSLVSFPMWAKREGIPNGGRPAVRGENEEVGPLSIEQEALWVDLLQKSEAVCVRCGGRNTKKNGQRGVRQMFFCRDCNRSFVEGAHRDGAVSVNCIRCCDGQAYRVKLYSNGKSIFRCRSCRRHFTLKGDGDQSPSRLLGEHPSCFRCGSSKTRSAGSIKADGRRLWKCLTCNKHFTVGSDAKPTERTLSQNQDKPPCQHCGSFRVNKSGITSSGAKSYRCKECGKCFLMKSTSQASPSATAPTSPCAQADHNSHSERP